jgi:hypothetical protein
VTTPDLQLLRPAPEAPDDLLRVMAAPGPAGPGGMFFVDPERAQACIDELRSAVLDLGTALDRLDLAYFPSPAEDPVSVNLAVQGGVMADRAHAYITAWRDQLEQTAMGLHEQLAAYRSAEDVNAQRLT